MYANQLEVKEGVVTGEVNGDIIDGEKKSPAPERDCRIGG